MNQNQNGLQLGIDLGTSTVKLVLLKDGSPIYRWLGIHYGKLLPTLAEGLRTLPEDGSVKIAVTGSNSASLLAACPELMRLDEIPAITGGIRALVPQAGSIIEIGSQGARFITDLDKAAPRFSVNEHCAGGTGSFFEDQMDRVGLKLEQYSEVAEQAQSVPRLSGRCAVFAKTDIIHRQQEGVPTPDILLGLCYAMIRNYKAVIVRDLPMKTPVVFCGGVTCNTGVIRAIREVFGLSEQELIVPEQARFEAALGAALAAEGAISPGKLAERLENAAASSARLTLPKLPDEPADYMTDPPATHCIPAGGVSLGIDIGSTSTDLVLLGADNSLVDYQYLRTAGNPERAVRNGLASIRERYGELTFTAVGVTGSGRERIGRLLGADAVRDEITAQARGAAQWVPEVDTVFEIGGQDSKYICLKNGEAADFRMNKICAAGTGSFVEEQAARMGIPIQSFGPLALTAEAPAELGERCTVFIETAIAGAAAEGVSQANIAAGLCHAIVRNYLHKVVGTMPVGEHIVLQGGVAYNPGIVAAFRSHYGSRLTVNPCFPVSGAFGAALLARESMEPGAASTFKGYDFPAEDTTVRMLSPEILRNIEFYQREKHFLLENYDGTLDPNKKTVGVPYVLMIHHFFPMANAYFKSLGFNVLLSKPTDEETIRLSQATAQGEPCYPVKLIYGHMQQLADAGVDYIFLPSIHTMKHETSKVAHNYGCVYMQTAAESVFRSLKLDQKGITLLNPVFDLDMGAQTMAMSMVGLGKLLNKPAPFCMKALADGSQAVKKYSANVERQGRLLLDSLGPEDKVLVLITRPYGIGDPVLNMGIPEKLMERGHKVITLSHLPGHALDISQDYGNLYWPFGQHIISGAKLVAKHPNLYAVYLTNHGCGADTMLAHYFRQEMGSKPYLQIEVDEHFSPVGVITRIEAFLNSISHRPVEKLPADFNIEDVTIRRNVLPALPDKETPVYLPDFGLYTEYLRQYLSGLGCRAEKLPPFTPEALLRGRTMTSAKEYVPFPALLGQVLLHRDSGAGAAQYLLPCTRGSEPDGQYARAIRGILNNCGEAAAGIASPMLETMPELPEFEKLFRAVAAGDLLYAAPAAERERLAPAGVPTDKELEALAAEIGALPLTGRVLLAVATPLTGTVLADGVPELLETGGDTVLHAPLSEYLWMLWSDQAEAGKWKKQLHYARTLMDALHRALGKRSPFAPKPELLQERADAGLPGYAGGNGRWRYARVQQPGEHIDAVLHFYPRYENTAMILDMRGMAEHCPVPLYPLAMDGDWDESAEGRLRSFLYYCGRNEK